MVCALVGKNTDHYVCSVVWISSFVVRALAGKNTDHHLCIVDGWFVLLLVKCRPSLVLRSVGGWLVFLLVIL